MGDGIPLVFPLALWTLAVATFVVSAMIKHEQLEEKGVECTSLGALDTCGGGFFDLLWDIVTINIDGAPIEARFFFGSILVAPFAHLLLTLILGLIPG